MTRIALRALLFVAGVAVVGGAAETEACVNGVEHAVDPRVELVAGAERATAAGRHAAALQSVARAVRSKEIKLGASTLDDRAYLVAALAVARTGGRYGWRGEEAPPGKGMAENLQTAIGIVRHFYEKRPDDAAVATSYAEVISHEPSKEQEALRILSGLEVQDVLASAHGYAALARLRRRSGSGAPGWIAPALEALEIAPGTVSSARCEKMAKGAGVCPEHGSVTRVGSQRPSR
jgi:hypothetical protein